MSRDELLELAKKLRRKAKIKRIKDFKKNLKLPIISTKKQTNRGETQ